MRTLVLGANGFVGEVVLDSFLRAGINAVGVARRARDGRDLQLVDSLTDGRAVRSLIRRCRPDSVVNCAGVIRGGPRSSENVTITKTVIEALADSGNGPTHLVITGSAASYGIVGHELPIPESHPLRPSSEYGISKASEEAEAFARPRRKGLPSPVTVLRVFNPIGPGMSPHLLAPRVIEQAEAVRAGRSDELIVSRLDAKRDYVDIRDVSRAYLAALRPGAPGGTFNVGSGIGTSNHELARCILSELGLEDVPIRQMDSSPQPIFAAVADISKIKTDFDWSPRYHLEQSVRNLLDVRRSQQGM